jgi:diguanylate cyclase (GGDEF)-like protein
MWNLRFRSLRTRLSVLYAGLFTAAMLCISLALYVAIESIASVQVGRELVASGAIYDRLWQTRSDQLQQAATLLSRDFGFRSALATGDKATALSAIGNLKSRMNVGEAYVVTVEGAVLGATDPQVSKQLSDLWGSLDSGKLVGVAMVGSHPKQIVAAPILAPNLFGWVLFAVDLDARQMRSLEGLSPIVLDAGIVSRQAGGAWTRVAGDFAELDPASAEAINGHLDAKASFELRLGPETSFSFVKSLPTLDNGERAALLLLYPKSAAMAPYRPVQAIVALLALIALGIVVLATWRTAARITRPLAQLDDAVSQFAAGARAEVVIEGEDELARLANSFNNMVREIDERERHIAHLAFNDVLTGLPNRSMFQKQAEQFLGMVQSGGHRLALFCIDLDNFKSVNDTLGHPVGDAMLVAVASRLRQAASGCFVSRIGGDEFVIAQLGTGAREETDKLARAIIAAIQEPLVIDGHEIVPGASIGIALAERGEVGVDTLLRNADLALYRAKDDGRGIYCYFEAHLNDRAQSRRKIETDLRKAIEAGEFELYFQPLFDLKANRIGSFEALIRWNHPERGMISPVEFIPVAEDSGLIVPIGAWVMREACARAMQWPEHVRVAVNVSSVQFRRRGLNEIVLQALSQSGLSPDRLEIEITESIFLDSGEDTLKLLHGLRALGIRIALDDFGTGYSSLSYLQAFPFDKIKIDRSFIQNLLTRPGAVAVVRAITDLADALGMETTAEGVEETGQLTELRAQGCTSVQGFLFSRPIDSAAVLEMLKTDPGSMATRAA